MEHTLKWWLVTTIIACNILSITSFIKTSQRRCKLLSKQGFTIQAHWRETAQIGSKGEHSCTYSYQKQSKYLKWYKNLWSEETLMFYWWTYTRLILSPLILLRFGIDMFVLAILNKGFKRKCHFNSFIFFCFISSDQVFFQQSRNICKILEEGILGNIGEKP